MELKDVIYLSHQKKLQIVEFIIDNILEDYDCEPERMDSDNLQQAVQCQVAINRVVYLLNRKQEEE